MFDVTFIMVWFDQNIWAACITIIILAYVAGSLGELLITPLVRRTIGRLHSGARKEDIKKRQDTLISLLHVLLKISVWLVAILAILNRMDVNIATLLAGAGLIGVVVGLGAQSIIKDFLSGLFIILESQYRIGDIVELDGSIGTVEQIGIRSTVLRDIDGGVHFIPNGSITRVVNKTLGFSKINLTVSVNSATNIDRLSTVINEVGEAMATEDDWKEKIIRAPHFSSINNFTDTAIEIKITGKTAPSTQWEATNELRRRLLTAFKKHRIDLA